MTITHLSLTNFMNISSANLTFQKGINVFSGKNGQGKSAVFEALSFCLLGKRRGDSWKDYIKTKEEEFVIDLDIINSGKTIKFHFVGNKNAPQLSRIITTNSQTYSNSECDSFLESLFDAEMLESVLFTMQDSPSIASMTSGERRAIFKKVFNTDFLEPLNRIHEDLESLSLKKNIYSARRSALETKQYSSPGRLEVIDESVLEENKEELKNLLEEKKSFERSIQIAYSEDQKVRTELLKKSQDIANLSSIKGSIESSLREKEKSIKSLEDSINQLEDKYNKSREENNSYELDLKNIQLEITSFPLENLEKDLAEKKERIAYLNSQISILNSQIEMHNKGVCSYCGQVCTQEHKVSLTNLLHKFQLDLQNTESQYSILAEKHFQYDSLIARREKVLSVMSISKRDIDKYFNKLGEVKSYLDENNKAKDLLEKDLKHNTEELEVIRDKIDKLNAKLSSEPISFNFEKEPRIRELQETIQDTESSLRINKEKTKLIHFTEKEKEKDKKIIEDLSININKLDQDEQELDVIKHIFEIHLPNYINQKACDLLQAYMSSFLSSSKEGFSVNLKQNKKGIDFLYKANEESDWLQAKLASGFESALLTLAFKCAVARAYGANLLVLDEPDKAATEDASALLFQTIVEDLGGFEQIFIITHRNNSLEYLQENNALIYRVHQGEFEVYE